MRARAVLVLVLVLACAACKEAEPSAPAAAASSPAATGEAASKAEEAWTDRGVRFSAHYTFYPSFQAAVDAESEGAPDAIVAEGSPDFEAARVEVTASPRRGAGFPWTFETTFGGAPGGSSRRWSCSRDSKSGVCRALVTFPRGLRNATTRVVHP